MRKSTFVPLLVIAVAVASCGGGVADDAASDGVATTMPASEEVTVSSPTEDTTGAVGEAMEPTDPPTTSGPEPISGGVADAAEPIPTTSHEDPIVDAARADLAGLVGADPSEVLVVSVEAVTWRDGSIGCPQPGMSYTQALVPGTRIILELGGVQYSYHAGRNGEPFYCAIPSEPLDSEAPPPIDQ